MYSLFIDFIVLQYADREFYKDWWNSPSLDIFWRKWNILVHEWLLRHIFITSMKAKASKQTATLLTFLISAILHEFVFWVGFRVIRPWFFFGMFAQGTFFFLEFYKNFHCCSAIDSFESVDNQNFTACECQTLGKHLCLVQSIFRTTNDRNPLHSWIFRGKLWFLLCK